jgi:hypothetical protein
MCLVRRRHRDTFTLSHYHNPPGDLRRLTKLNYDHGNPLIIVYYGDLLVRLLWL